MKWLPAPRVKGFPALVVMVILGVLAYLLLLFPSQLDVFTRLLLIVQVAAAGLLTYALLAWLVPRHINRLAETTTPRELVAVTVLASGGQAWGIACLALLPAIHALLGVEFTAADYLTNGPVFALVTAAVTAIYSLKLFIHRWKGMLVLEQELKQTVLRAEFESLKNQVNPHFLFNSLNILSALIPDDPGNAVAMVERMSKVFRYNLQNTDNATSRLGDELKIVESYLFIHQMRFGENLRYKIAVPPEESEKQVVTQGLLTLVENALKHNECSREKPLHLRIEAAGGWLVVTNTLQIKNRLQTDSTGIGLKNLRHRNALLTERELVVAETSGEFVVKVPLL
ncbi:MAG: histidine kinase [Cytophagaceae bacterium]|nr:histidine kinase [Cytophagaceae bacterium]